MLKSQTTAVPLLPGLGFSWTYCQTISYCWQRASSLTWVLNIVMRLVCIMLSTGVKTLWCRVEWFQLLLLLCCPTSEIKGCCCNPQFTLILLPVDFRVFTYNCNVRFYQPPALSCSCEHCLWKLADTTHNLHKTLSGSDTPATLFRQAQAPHRQEFQLPSAFSLLFLVIVLIIEVHNNNENLRKSRILLTNFQWNDRGLA